MIPFLHKRSKRYPLLLDRLSHRFAFEAPVDAVVRKIVDAVRKEGDRAVLRFTRRFDRMTLTPATMEVGRDEIAEAYRKAEPTRIEALKFAAGRIISYHRRQRPTGFTYQEEGVTLGERVHPLERVGIYVPGGKAAYPSSVLMNALPAKVAGVQEIIMVSPTPRGETNPYVLIAADLAGVSRIFRIGGAQAVAALAFGTRTIPKVDKIVGPGNLYVNAAKRMVFGLVDIDMIAGPSELLVIADDKANPTFVASDLLSQAEHDEEAYVFCIVQSEKMAQAVRQEMGRQVKKLARRKIAQKALRRHGFGFVIPEIPDLIEAANRIAPEHLALFMTDATSLADRFIHVGALFLGEYTPQALGDYLAGPNHVLPTGGTARFFSPLSVWDFVKKSSVIAYSREGLERMGWKAIALAEIEGLGAHARMISIRLEGRRQEE